jgi:signal transduction histidine kinase
MTLSEPATTEQELRRRIAHLEKELAAAQDRLRTLQQHDSFYTNALTVSHELRTPITLISGYAQQLLLRWHSTDEVRRHAMVEKINVSSRRLARLIDDILLISEVEAGELPLLVKKDVSLRGVVDEALTEVRDRYRTGLPEVTVSGDDVCVLADGFRLEQVLICLLDNAVKHSPLNAPVTVRWYREGDEMVVAISDRGGGIGSAEMERLFTPFGRLHRTPSHGRSGVGLGLYIARRLTEAMNGHIWVESERGRGSTFHIAVPVAVAAEDEYPQTE